mmetsp:Transcript_31479/g.58619  ORF Transcript_31479/g.58619 Transcript_31479/m.58619 type:complete len:292 (-) Transcript_31479:700-1575(-)
MLDFSTIVTNVLAAELYWLNNHWLCWGLGPLLAAAYGFLVPTVLLEYSLHKEKLYSKVYVQKNLIEYRTSKNGRIADIAACQNKRSFSQQLTDSASLLLGFGAIVNGTTSALLCDYFIPTVKYENPLPCLYGALAHLALMFIVGDFFLYWGHRIQHESEFLWKHFHSYHHQIDTPTAVSTLSIDTVDATLQGGLPLIFAAILIHPHPITFYAYVFLRLCDNVVNHSGLKNQFYTDLLALKFLPFRASAGHHDYHHKFSNYSKNAKNYAEYFLVWDQVFGTMTDVSRLQKSE